jgi:hypothetical protein
VDGGQTGYGYVGSLGESAKINSMSSGKFMCTGSAAHDWFWFPFFMS